MDKQYKEIDGLFYDERTPEAVCNILSRFYHMSRTGRIAPRLRVWYGDTETGRCWMEENDITGYVGRSTGPIKIPLLIHNSRSYGGGAILDHCIIRITARNPHVNRIDCLYSHPDFHIPTITIEGASVLFDGEIHANFKTAEQAHRYAAFMAGERMGK